MTSRAEILLASVPREAHIIEIGPSYNPIAPKAEGWKTKTLDHTTREGLIAHYRGEPGVDVNRIEEVDFIWTGGPISDAVPAALHGTFDAFIASHVIEHTPDLIAFLDSAAVLLKPDGVVVLAIPDKRYCFDYFQPLTTTGRLLAAHAERRSRHTRRLVFDHFAYAVKNGGVGAWALHPAREMRFFHSIEEARKLFDSMETREEYVDVHAWRFTPASFELLLLELARLCEANWYVDRITPANGCEFYAWLRPSGGVVAASLTETDIAAQRLALLKRTLMETREQIDWLVAGEPNLVNAPPALRTSAASIIQHRPSIRLSNAQND
jgi:SAM-dependent methyltransferase